MPRIKTIKCKGTAGDLVTNADIECEKLIIEYLEKETPYISILAEESGYKSKDGELKWCIDPLDGTTNYAHGYPFFATSIGLIWNSNPILGAISVPSLNEIYYASPEHGSYCNGEKINVTNTNSLSDSLLVTGFAYDRREVLDNNYSEFCWLTHLTHGVRRGYPWGKKRRSSRCRSSICSLRQSGWFLGTWTCKMGYGSRSTTS